jgi:glycine cleavage system transcriptional repressor
MNTEIVLTLTGPDRIGIVDDVTRLLLELGGNVETSRMTRLGGAFAILMLVSMPAEKIAGLDDDIGRLTKQGYKITTNPTVRSYADSFPDWLPYQIEVTGADHEGIIHEIARSLSRRGINIESMDTGTTQAPISGAPLFMMTAAVVVPPSLCSQDWEGELNDVGHRLNVEIKVSAVKKE